MGYIFDAIQRADSAGPPPVSAVDKAVERNPIVAPATEAKAATPPAAEVKPFGLTLAKDADHSDYQSVTETLAETPEQASIGTEAAIKSESTTEIDDRLVGLSGVVGPLTEEYRSIRTGLLARWQNQRHLVHTITSATPQDGKTITSLNLGLSFAELQNRKIVVVEADLRLPQFATLLRLTLGPGLVDLLEKGASLDRVTHTVGPNGLHVIPAGVTAADRAVQLLSGSAMASLVKQLRLRYDHVIIDTPPVVELADAGILGAISDDVLLIARMNHTPRSLVHRAIRVLASYNAPVAGVIATDHQPTRGHGYKHGYRYAYRRYYGKAAA